MSYIIFNKDFDECTHWFFFKTVAAKPAPGKCKACKDNEYPLQSMLLNDADDKPVFKIINLNTY